MRIEILTFEGCPHSEATSEVVRQALWLEHADAAVEVIDVSSQEAAHALRFLGSPSVRVNGEDAEPGARYHTDYGLMCRMYHADVGLAGTLPIELIRDAIRRALGGERELLANG